MARCSQLLACLIACVVINQVVGKGCDIGRMEVDYDKSCRVVVNVCTGICDNDTAYLNPSNGREVHDCQCCKVWKREVAEARCIGSDRVVKVWQATYCGCTTCKEVCGK